VHVGFALLTLFPGRVGGSETNVRGLLAEFAAGNGPERVTVLANRHVMARYREYARGPVELHSYRSYRPGDRDATRLVAMAYARAVPRRVARDLPRGLDVVHYPVTVPIPAAPTPRVVSLYDVQHHDLPRLFSRAERRFRRWAYDGAAREATLVVTASEYSRGRICELLGMDPERVEVVHHGLDHGRFSPEAADDERLLSGLALPDRFVVYPANLWPHKNHARLLEALARVPDRDLALVLTGQDYGRLGALGRRAVGLDVEHRVRHLGHLPPEALPALYRAARALVFPSLYEGFGAPPLEAMACGCPVAAARRASLPEICGDAALLFDPDSVEEIAAAIPKISADEDLRGRLRAAGLRRAAAFTWRATAARQRAIYARAAATHAPVPGSTR
jgi:glycosyltransferase involved in cell wall biosynthesis